MSRYGVIKYFGHFRQAWEVMADSSNTAWTSAERIGKLVYQTVHQKRMDDESFGYVINLDNKELGYHSISEETYRKWLAEAIDRGMVATEEEYKMATGLPFCDVW